MLIPSDSPEYVYQSRRDRTGQKHPCADCGAPCNHQSKVCRACYEKTIKGTRKCACGERKSYDAPTCQKCYFKRIADERVRQGGSENGPRTSIRKPAPDITPKVAKPLGTITDKGGKPRAARHAAAPATITPGERERITPILRGLCRIQECEEAGKRDFFDARRFEIRATLVGKGVFRFTAVAVGTPLEKGTVPYQRFFRRFRDSRTWDMSPCSSLDSARMAQRDAELEAPTHA